ncbi:MAG TPA: tetratricopeptide repeat protein [Actinotalea sp.]|nr:tetratricopeptide repeat protein [Actinotalea sp.]
MEGGLTPAELRAMWNFADSVGSEAVLRAAADGSATDPSRQAELLTQVARALGIQQRFEEAHLLLDALEPLTAAVSARILLERGRLHRDEGQVAAAVSTFEAAAVAAERAGLEPLQVDALHMLAVAHPHRGEAWTVHALAVVGRSADPEVGRWAVALENNWGWNLMDAGRPEDALQHFDAARAAALELGNPEQEQIGRWAVARCLRELGRTEEALAIQRDLAAERPDDPYVHEELQALGAWPQD